MTQPPQYSMQPPAPSWTAPILLGIAATVALHVPALFASAGWIVVCCCVGCSGVPAGVFPALVAMRRDPALGPGSGFAVAFIGVGLGAIAMATVAMVQGWQIGDDTLEMLRETLMEQAQADPQITPEDVDNSIEVLAEGSRYFPVVGAGLVTLWGGLAGAITVALGRRRRRPRYDPYNPYGYPPSGPDQGQQPPMPPQ